MIRSLTSCVRLLLILTIITGGLYPLMITLAAQMVFPRQAGGSLIVVDGKAIGSSLVGQRFLSPRYFWPRPSAVDFNAAASSGSNLGPTNPTHLDAVADRARQLGATSISLVPVDLVTTSASGLDPHITPAAAKYQVPRVAQARGLSEEDVRRLVKAATDERTLGFLGERRVNVLALNRALDAMETVK